MKRVFGADDIVVVIATVRSPINPSATRLRCPRVQIVLIAYAVVLIVAADKGLGRHIQYIVAHGNLRHVSLLAEIAQTLAILACTLGKSAFAITLMRIFLHSRPWAIWTLWFVIVSMNLVNFLCAIFVFFQCQDPRALWDTGVLSVCWPAYVFTDFSLFVGCM